MGNKLYLYILIVAIVLIFGGSVFLFYRKKQEEKAQEALQSISHAKPGVKAVADPKILVLQKHINEMLPADYPKITEDGIWGPETKKAYEYLKEHKQSDKTGTLETIVNGLGLLNPVTAPVSIWNLVKKYV